MNKDAGQRHMNVTTLVWRGVRLRHLEDVEARRAALLAILREAERRGALIHVRPLSKPVAFDLIYFMNETHVVDAIVDAGQRRDALPMHQDDAP
jgi:hypothetical protein